MEIHGDLTPIFGANLIQLDGTRLGQIRNEELLQAIDKLCQLGSQFAHARQQVTTIQKLIANPDQKLYLYWEFDSSSNKSLLLGYCKIGHKLLYLYDKNQAAYEGELLCVLDVYVHQGHQRRGIGRRLFDTIFQMEGSRPMTMALDNPSVALLGFLAKVYGLDKPVWQNTNFVVFQQLFDLFKGDDTNAPEGWRRETIPKRLTSGEASPNPRLRYLIDAIPGHPAKSRPGELFDSPQIDETLSTRSAQTRQRKHDLLSSKPLWMFRKEVSCKEHKCAGCLQYLMLAASPLYLNAHLNNANDESKKKGKKTPLVEGLFDDLLSARFGIVVRKEKRLTDSEVDDWFTDQADSELAVQYANGKSLLMLLCRQNGLAVAHEMARFHNKLSVIKTGKPAIYVSANIVVAERDIRLHFPEFRLTNQSNLDAVREYAASHLAAPLVRELAALQIAGREAIKKGKVEEETKEESEESEIDEEEELDRVIKRKGSGGGKKNKRK